MMAQMRFFTKSTGAWSRGLVGLALAALILATVPGLSCKRSGAKAPGTVGAGGEEGPLDSGWPRLYTIDGNEIMLQQPQIDEWRNYSTLFARLAVTVKLKGSQETIAGIVELKAATVTDHDARLVTMYRPEITTVRFPEVPPEMTAELENAVRSVSPARDITEISLDRVLAYVEQSQAQDEGVAVNLEPPPIFYSDSEAILISFLGPPRFSPIEGTGLEFGLNTNWDVIRDPATGRAYLLYIGSWLTTDDLLQGSWGPAGALPGDMKKLPKDEAWERVRQSVPGQPPASVPRVFVSERPGEVIITAGRPQFRPIPGTGLSAISNSENTLFYHQVDGQFYFLAAGRWFRAPDLTGPWSAATRSLPADFAAIPKDDPSADILGSVPGTEEAQDVVLLASIPKMAVVNRDEAQPEVNYDGEPEFEPIEKTSVKYAVNTANDVFIVGSTYYTCYEGVWFIGSSAAGPWSVADSVPKEIYTIPPTSPKYNVTYVTVYESTPTTVTTGYTSGYNGEVVSSGVVMFGLCVAVIATSSHYHYGYYPPYYWGYGPRPPYHHYGHYNYYAGPHGYGWSAHGPYGGAGYGAKYNPSTGIYSRGGYAYGPGGGAAYRAGYNPATGARGAQRGGYNAYGSWKQSAVVKGDDWVRGGSASNSQGTLKGFQTSEGAAGVGYKGREGSGFVVKDGEGNMYAGKDGNVYKRDESGDWSSATRGGASASTTQAQTGDRAGTSASAQPKAGTANTAGASAIRPSTGAANPASGTVARPSTGAAGPAASADNRPSGAVSKPSASANTGALGGSSSSVQSGLNSDYQARQTGNQRTTKRSGSGASRGGGRRR
jgi:hypothetical protein